MIWIKLAYKEIRNNPRFSLFFIFNLSLGLVGFIALNSFQSSIHNHISNRSKAILTADLDIRSTYELSEKDLTYLESYIDPIIEKTKRISFMSMIASETDSRLVQVLAVGDRYPLYGEIKLSDHIAIGQKEFREKLIGKANLWVEPEILLALNTSVNSSVTIGKKVFSIADTIVDTSSGFVLTGGFAYRLFMGIDQAKETGLIDRGSRRRHHYLYKIPADVNVEAVAKRLNEAIAEKYGKNTYISVSTHNNAGRRLSRFMGYMNDYLGLVSLVALFLAGVGTAYLFRSYLAANLKDIAILMVLGAEKKRAYFFLLLQLVALGTVSALISVALAYLALPLISALLGDFLPKGFATIFNWQSVWLALAMGSLGSILFCLPILSRIHRLKPLIVFNDTQRRPSSREKINLIGGASYLPLLLFFWLVSVWQSSSWLIGSIFIGSLLAAFLILGLVGFYLIFWANRLSSNVFLVFRLAFRNLYRNRSAVISSFLAIGLGSLLINLIPQFDYGLQKEMKRPETSNLPSFFLFDIQSDQVETLSSFLNTHDYKVDNLSAWVESRLTHINGTLYSKFEEKKAVTREQQRERYSRRRTQNLSYRMELYPSESIVVGKPFSGTYDFDSENLPEISLDEQFASNLGVSVGSTLTFDVQGIPVKGQIVNIRKIKWQTMQPNFYVLFQPGVLEDAPGTFLGTIYKVRSEDKVKLQNEIVRRFPNVSMVDVSMAVKTILEITGQISWAIQVMAFSAIFVGMVVVYSIARYNSQSRMQEINLLKILGAGFNNIRQIIILEFCLFGISASFTGSLLSLAASWIMSYLIFDSIWAITWNVVGLTVISVTVLTMFAAYLGTRKALKQKPISLLQAV